MGRRRRGLVGVMALGCALVLGGCADDPAEPGETGTATPTASEPGEPTESPSEEPTPSPTATDGADEDLPGEAWESGPAEGDELAVVGVRADDVLNLRSGPGVDFETVGDIEPLGSAEATGRGRMVDDAVWVEVTEAGDTGWANLRYLAYLGEVTDITSELGDLPSGTDLEDLAREIADRRRGDTPQDVVPEVVVVDGPHVGDLAEVTADVLGFADDSVLGSRLHVFAQADGAGFAVRTVEHTVLCARGVDDGLCV